ncbi:MAG: hypothetical protein ACXWVH_06090 [Caulobacteraceae bacterium]
MEAKRHALHARALIRACGGLKKAEAACRLKRSRLSEFQDPHSGAFMPTDVLADLEQLAGDNCYSAAIAADAGVHPADCVVAGSCETAEAAFDLQRVARTAGRDGRITALEDRLIDLAAVTVESRARRVRACSGIPGRRVA